MLQLTINYDDFQFVEQQTQMAYPLDALGGSQVELTVYADKEIKVWVENTDTEDQMMLAIGQTIPRTIFETIGFNLLKVKSSAATTYGIRLYVQNSLQSEQNDGIPVVLEPLTEDEMRFERSVQQALIRDLSAHGADPELIEDLLTGLNADEEDFDLDDDDMPSEAEMNEMIDEARRRAQQEAEEAPPPSPPSEQDADDTSNSESE